MLDRRRQLGGVAIMMLVLLRLAIGWHFYREGSSKFSLDKRTNHLEVNFSAEGFLSQAKGPLAERFQSFAPSAHHWSKLLARSASEKSAEDGSASGPPYAVWSERISDDWQQLHDKFAKLPGLSDEQVKAAEKVLADNRKELADYLAAQTDAIADYQNDLSRLERLQSTPEAAEVPFVQKRIDTQSAQYKRTPAAWVAQVNALDGQYAEELRSILTDEQATDSAKRAAFDEAMTTDEQHRLHMTNVAVAWLTVGVGVCLLLGFFTRLASIAGALFLASVVATQPPWIPGTAETYYQAVEMVALLVLAATGAGRWGGLDFFTYSLWNRCCGKADE